MQNRQDSAWVAHCFGLVVGPITALVLLLSGAAQAIEIQRVISPGGIEAWLVADPKIPVIAIEFSFRSAGAAADPAGKEGLAALTAATLDEGAGDLDSQEFQRQLDDRAIGLSFSASRDSFSGSLKTLSHHRAEAFQLTSLALTKPRFDPDAIDRERNAMLANYRRDLTSPNAEAGKTFFRTVFPDHPYGRETNGNPASLAGVAPEDLRQFVGQRLTRDRLLVAVCGDLTAAELGPALDRVFGDLPATASQSEIADTSLMASGATVVVPQPSAQSVIMTGTAGVSRHDPDWFAALILNRVLGGSGFESRLMQEIRVKRGLTYGIYSQLLPLDHASLIIASGSTANANAGEMLSLVKSEWLRLRERGVTAEELADAKTYLTGSLALQFTSSPAIAAVVLQVLRDRLGIDYLDRRAGLIEAVTLDDVNRVAEKLLNPSQLTTIIVGQPQGLAAPAATPGKS